MRGRTAGDNRAGGVNADYQADAKRRIRRVRAYSKGEGLQGIFELAILWAVVWAVPIGMALGIEALLDAAFPFGRAGVHTIIALGVGLLAAIAIISNGDTEKGSRVGRALGRLIHDYAFHIALVAGCSGLALPLRIRPRARTLQRGKSGLESVWNNPRMHRARN